MNRKLYQVPATKVNSLDNLKKTTDMHDSKLVGSFIHSTTEDKLCKIFSNGIDEDIKRHADILDLHEIKGDIDSDSGISNTSHWYTLINIFTNTKEELIGKTVNFKDIPDCIKGICENVKILQPPKDNNKLTNEKHVKNIGFSFIIPAIRNGIMHNRYIITKRGLYIHSEKAWKRKISQKDENGNNIVEEKDFEAFVDLKFFEKFINFCLLYERKPKTKTLDISNINRNYGFKENINNLRIRESIGKEKGLLGSKIGDNAILNLCNVMLNNKMHYCNNELTCGQKEFISEYFKTQDFNRRNLGTLSCCFSEDCIVTEYKIGLPKNQNGLDEHLLYLKRITLISLLNYIEKKKNSRLLALFMILNPLLEGDKPSKWRIWQDSEIKKSLNSWEIGENFVKNFEKDVLGLRDFLLEEKDYDVRCSQIDHKKNYLKVLYLSKFYINNPKLELAQPQKRIGDELRKQGYNYIKTRCEKKPENYWSNDAKKKSLDKKLGNKFRKQLLIQKLMVGRKVNGWIMKNTEDMEKIMVKINPFITQKTRRLYKKDNEEDNKKFKEILEDNVRNVIKDWKEKLDNITIIGEEEHIRNAFAHHNYTIVPGFNKILLWDPSIDDTPNWEKVYDLDDLYQNAVDRVDEDYLGKK